MERINYINKKKDGTENKGLEVRGMDLNGGDIYE